MARVMGCKTRFVAHPIGQHATTKWVLQIGWVRCRVTSCRGVTKGVSLVCSAAAKPKWPRRWRVKNKPGPLLGRAAGGVFVWI